MLTRKNKQEIYGDFYRERKLPFPFLSLKRRTLLIKTESVIIGALKVCKIGQA